MSFANINYGLAAGDAFNAFLGGVHKEFFSGNPTASGPNVLKNLLEALLAGDLLGGTPSTPGAPGGTPSAPANPLGALLGGLTVPSTDCSVACSVDCSADSATPSPRPTSSRRSPLARPPT